jgi:hypothetical protein
MWGDFRGSTSARARAWRAGTCLGLFLASALAVPGCGGGGGGGGSGSGSSSGAPPPSLKVTTSALPAGQVGAAYSASLAASGGTMPLSWALSSGTMPAGLTLNASSGAISGTPSAPATGALGFTVTDSSSPAQSSTTSLGLTISAAALAVTTTSLPSGQMGKAYTATLAATGGTAPLTWSVTSGTVPAGLAFDAASGAIYGTPTAAAASVPLTFTVADSGNPQQTKTLSTTLSIAAAATPLAISTTTLPNGQIGTAYSAMLSATGGTGPYTWSLMSGTVPAGLAFDAASGTIYGTPTAAANQTPLTFKVQDSSNPALTASANLTMNVSPASVAISITPRAAGLTLSQALPITATTDDNAGVTWSVTPSGGGSFSKTTSASGEAVTYTAPATPGAYTITATGATNGTQTATATIAVTDLAGVYTYHNDVARDGVNAQEYSLTTTSVSGTTFGKLFSCTVDGAIYGQPLWVANVTVNGAAHNLVFVATQHDSLFAFDADTSPCVQVWTASLIDTQHGGGGDETPVPAGTTGLVGLGYGDISPEVGITSTPVIDPATGTIYVLSKSVNGAQTNFSQRLHAIDITTGAEKPGSPTVIAPTYPGTGDGGTTVSFNPRTSAQRAALAFVNGTVYVAWASHEDAPPYYGWVVGYTYNGSAFAQASVLNITPNFGYGGIWMSGAAPAADAANNLYVLSGNGMFNADSASAPNNDYGDSFLQLSPALVISQYFTPHNEDIDAANDRDFGAGGAAVLADLPASSPVQHLVIGGGKDQSLYVLNRDKMGGYSSTDANLWQKIPMAGVIFSTGAFWNSQYYIAAAGQPLTALALDAGSAKFGVANVSTSPASGFGFPGTTPSVSVGGVSNAIVWAIETNAYCTNQSHACGPAVLHAYDATDVSKELWNSAAATADTAGNAVKFAVPTVANGKVYIGTRGNNTGGANGSTSVSGELDVYGLKP